MNGRMYFHNPYYDNDKDKPISNYTIRCIIQTEIAKLLYRDVEEKDFKVGAYIGVTGIVYALLKALPLFPRRRRQLRYVMNKWMRKQMKKVEVYKKYRRSPMLGAMSIYTMAIFYEKKMFDKYKEEYFEKIEELARELNDPTYIEDGILHGRAGFLSLMLILKLEADITLPNSIMDLIQTTIRILIKNGKEYARKFRLGDILVYECRGKVNLGASRGTVGILQMFLGFYDKLAINEKELVIKSIKWIRRRWKKEYFPWEYSKNRREKKKPIQWCNGSIGFSLLMLAMCKNEIEIEPNKQTFKDAGNEALFAVWQTRLPKKDCGLCHGIAGHAYTYLVCHRIYRYSFDALRLRDYAKLFGSEKFYDLMIEKHYRNSLFLGTSGIIAFLCDFVDDVIEEAQFPLFPMDVKDLRTTANNNVEERSDAEKNDEERGDEERSDEKTSSDEIWDEETFDEKMSDEETSDEEMSDEEMSDEEMSDEEASD